MDAHFCPQCEKILAVSRHGDFFTFFGFARKLRIDADELERRFRGLSRQFHPDYFYNATPRERLASLERASYLNDAYRTLRHPFRRVEYLLKIEGLLPKDRREQVQGTPPSLLEEVFELNERIDAIRAARAEGAAPDRIRERLAEARQPIEARRAAHARRLEALSEEWDRGIDAAVPVEARRATLEALRALVLERTYIDNLLAAVDREQVV
jgi:molecular chaperone HscB